MEIKIAANAKSKSSVKSQEQTWAFTSAIIESFIDYLNQYKCLCEFNSVDFNAEKVQLYEKVRQGTSNSSQFSQSQIREGQL